MKASHWNLSSPLASGLLIHTIKLFPVLAALAILAGDVLPAAPVFAMTDATPTYLATRPQCRDRADTVDLGPCGSKAYIDTTLASSTSAFVSPDTFAQKKGPESPANSFTKGFDTWNAANGGNWSLVNGGNLNIKFNVSTFDAKADDEFVGGLDIQIDTSDYVAAVGGPTAAQLTWSQALYVNYQPGQPDPANPINTLDTFSFSGGPGLNNGSGPFNSQCTALPGSAGGTANNTTASNIPANLANPQKAYCDPIYPFQGPTQANGISSIFDGPRGFYSRPSSFRAIALLSTVTFKTDALGAVTDRILTVYNGVSYGFDTFVPEPGYYLILSIGFVALFLFQRRRNTIANGSRS